MISEKAYAKVNLSLYITGVREDGYHILDTVMQRVSLFDTVRISKNNKSKIEITSNLDILTGEKNICYSAANAFFDATGIKDFVTVNVEKNIPLAAGLGGGSADAAAVLNLLNKMYDNPLSDEKLCEIALRLGADVPFCLKGGSMRVKGIGEVMEKIDRKSEPYIVLVKDGEKASTAQMYKKLDNISIKKQPNKNDLMVSCLTKGDYKAFLDAIHNDFSYVWDYSKIEKELLDAGADKVSVSGSGPTVMGFFESKAAADSATEKLSSKFSFVSSVFCVNE